MKKRYLSSVLILSMLFSLFAVPGMGVAATDNEEVSGDVKIIDEFVEKFGLLAAIPRKSQHEKAVSDFLKNWMEDLGYTVRQNEKNDLIFDIPATPGMESFPLVGLQAHMDMVCVAKEGKKYDPLKDPIKPVIDREKGVMTADGTSLGADDGAGVVMIMMIAEGKLVSHGPLRIFLTTDEEGEMSGVLALTKEDVEGVKYLINVDGEESDTAIISSAADIHVAVSRKPKAVKPKKKAAKKITLSGLLGGHSGMMIDKGRCNGNIALAKLLTKLTKKMSYEMVSFHGGTADNAIPSKAEVVIQIAPKDEKELNSFIKKQRKELKKKYKGIEKNLKLTVKKAKRTKKVLKNSHTKSVLTYAVKVPDGVYTMSKDIEGLVESSSNLGMMDADIHSILLSHQTRSSSQEKLDELQKKMEDLAKSQKLSTSVEKNSRAWPVKTDSTLVPLVASEYEKLTGEEMKEIAVHAGLECGAFCELSPELDMVSIGPDVTNVHSPEETLYLNSIPKTYHLIEAVLSGIKS